MKITRINARMGRLMLAVAALALLAGCGSRDDTEYLDKAPPLSAGASAPDNAASPSQLAPPQPAGARPDKAPIVRADEAE